ncbi:MAG: bifunctional molybdopterin-guanine dinucleotide biosynthesis protein MobB/molybdopterin molybdotransferase MoeA, partial [bacterium]|nr:bifunctional molybdopterin-guanine dinucleotide biosynthesis protein MobB/molybdopterin molybdotransferase MoeA [bacterium]
MEIYRANNIPLIAITGKKNSGKTTVIESLIRLLTEKGWRVGTVKHHHHGDFEPDTPGKDSHR